MPPFEYQEISCLGSLDPLAMLRALDEGADGVLAVGCYVGRCRHLTGSQKARMVVGHVGDVMEEAGIPRDRVGVVLGSPLDEGGIVSEVKRFINALEGVER
jgi:coenzyme F420-reducing hydrogenase delta subunit